MSDLILPLAPIAPYAQRNAALFVDPTEPVQPMQVESEFRTFLSILHGLRIRTVLEIGAHAGGATRQFIKIVQTPGKVIAVDLPGGPAGSPETEEPLVALNGKSGRAGVYCRVILGDSRDPMISASVRAELPDGVDALFVDGGHARETAASDFRTYGPMVQPGGIIALHDCRDLDVGCGAVWRDLQEIGYLTRELCALPRGHPDCPGGYGIGIIYVENWGGDGPDAV